jgi:hypothetical protein
MFDIFYIFDIFYAKKFWGNILELAFFDIFYAKNN